MRHFLRSTTHYLAFSSVRGLPGAEKVTIKVNEGKAEIDVAEGKKIAKDQVERLWSGMWGNWKG